MPHTCKIYAVLLPLIREWARTSGHHAECCHSTYDHVCRYRMLDNDRGRASGSSVVKVTIPLGCIAGRHFVKNRDEVGRGSHGDALLYPRSVVMHRRPSHAASSRTDAACRIDSQITRRTGVTGVNPDADGVAV